MMLRVWECVRCVLWLEEIRQRPELAEASVATCVCGTAVLSLVYE